MFTGSKARSVRYVFILAFLLASFAASPVWPAEDTTKVVDQLTGQAESFRKEVRKTPEETPAEPPKIPQKEDPPSLEARNGLSFKIRNVLLDGNTLLPKKIVDSLLATLKDKETTWGELKALTQKITGLYHSSGYLTGRAYLPPQKTTDGAIRMQTQEGKVGKVRVEGNLYFKSDLYTRSLSFRPDGIFRYQDFETGIYRINRKPDRKVDGFLLAGEDPGTSDILLKARETFPIHAFYEFNNRGTNLTHRGRHLFGFVHNNLRGEGDSLNAILSLAEEGAFTAGGMQYLCPLGTRAVVSLETGYSESALVKHLKSAEVEGESISIVPGITRDLIESSSSLLSWALFFEFKDSKTLIDDHKSSFDRMRAIRTGPRLTMDDASGRSLLNGEIHRGIPHFLGGSDEVDTNASRPNSGGEFLYATAGVMRLHRLGPSFLYLRANGQWSPDNLTAVERYRAGGAFSVRGYPESEAVGDHGFDASAEWDFPLPFFKSRYKKTPIGALFVDAGKSFSRERSSPTDVKDKLLLGIGVGLRFQVRESIQSRLDWAYPLGDASSEKDTPRVHLAVRTKF